MPRFYLKPEDEIIDNIIYFSGEDVNHIKNVLRLVKGNYIIISSGSGIDYEVELVSFENGILKAEIIRKTENSTEPKINIILFQGVPKFDKFEFIIQKSVEIGVCKIVPVITNRTIVKFNSNSDIDKKVSRWQKIANEASKQCNRGRIPDISTPIKFKDAIKSNLFQKAIIPYEKEMDNKLKNCLQEINKTSINKIGVFIGPEGGFSEDEILMSKENDIESVSLGPRILRTETAGIVVLSAIMYEMGDVGL